MEYFDEEQKSILRGFPIPPMHSVKEFEQLLKRERFRADRNNHRIAMILFSLKENSDTEQNLSVLENVLRRSVRFTDEIGWFDDTRIAVIHTEAHLVEAEIFSENMESQMESLNIHIFISVFMYPSSKMYYRSEHEKNVRCSVNFLKKILNGTQLPWWKRSMDITVAFFALILLSPLFLAVAVIINHVSPGQILFKQERVGRGGKIFNLLKFRTMHSNNNESVHRQHAKDLIQNNGLSDKPMAKLDECDNRLIPLGYFIRQSCLDEMPQLINVLRGEMTIVGPRPCIPYEADEYLQWYNKRFDVTPGMTGLWQVSGKNRRTFEQMMRLDIEYSESRSFLLDIYIIAKTPFVIFSQVQEAFEKKLRSKRIIIDLKHYSGK